MITLSFYSQNTHNKHPIAHLWGWDMECLMWVWSLMYGLPSSTHWGRATHICVSKLTIIGSDNGLSPDRRQAIIWTNDRISLIGPSGTKRNFNQNLYIFIQENAVENVVWKMAAILSWPQCVNTILYEVSENVDKTATKGNYMYWFLQFFKGVTLHP